MMHLHNLYTSYHSAKTPREVAKMALSTAASCFNRQGKVRGQFRRCGILTNISRKEMRMAGWPDWRGIQNHDWLEYEEFDNWEYTISII